MPAQTLLALITAACVLTLSAAPATAGEDFPASIKEAEDHHRVRAYEQAIEAYEIAYRQARNATEEALALAKMGYTYAYGLKNFVRAREQADQALAIEDAHNVGRVIAMRVKAHCLMKQDADYDEAAEVLDKALALDEVNWARPSLALMLGDCHRFNRAYDEAIEAYASVEGMAGASNAIVGVAHLNIGMTYHYNLRQPTKAREAYGKALEKNPKLKAEIDRHLAKLKA